MVLEIRLGDVVRLKKQHPCGGDTWEVVRMGADIGIQTTGYFIQFIINSFHFRVISFLIFFSMKFFLLTA